jgi:hypothetical protein
MRKNPSHFPGFIPTQFQQNENEIFVYLAEGKRISFFGEIMYDKDTTERAPRSEN